MIFCPLVDLAVRGRCCGDAPTAGSARFGAAVHLLRELAAELIYPRRMYEAGLSPTASRKDI
jgi:hypothetical protein